MIAEIWNLWRHAEPDEKTGELIEFTTPAFAIITTKANELMAQVHNSKERTPTILIKELAEEWLSNDLSKQRIVEIATHQRNDSAYHTKRFSKNRQPQSKI